jgi:hypothetical protein
MRLQLFHFPNKDLFIELEREGLATTKTLDLCIDGTLATLEYGHSQREIFGRVQPKVWMVGLSEKLTLY